MASKATTAVASMTPASAARGDEARGAEALTDPLEKYPKPPFKKQSQPWPGLASHMEPPPDHGENSYRGSGRLAGRKALITGGDSGMGRAAAIAFAREGADVAINYFPSEEPDAQQVIELIRAEDRKGLALPGDLRDEKFCEELVRKAVEGLGGRPEVRQCRLDDPEGRVDVGLHSRVEIFARRLISMTMRRPRLRR